MQIKNLNRTRCQRQNKKKNKKTKGGKKRNKTEINKERRDIINTAINYLINLFSSQDSYLSLA